MLLNTPFAWTTFACILFILSVAAASPAPHTLSMEHSSKHRRASQTSTWLMAHNLVRLTHGAEPLTWSLSLANKAQFWANQCQFAHSDGALSSAAYGENIVAGTGFFPIQAAVDMFTNDSSNYDLESPSYTHWTQVVWKSTTQLGCATAHCDGIFDPKLGKATLHVCLYNPPGNVVGHALANVEI